MAARMAKQRKLGKNSCAIDPKNTHKDWIEFDNPSRHLGSSAVRITESDRLTSPRSDVVILGARVGLRLENVNDPTTLWPRSDKLHYRILKD